MNISHPETISAADALWSLIVRQNKSVQKDLARRLSELIDDEKKDAQQQYVRETLCRALAEVRDAQESGTALPDAKLLFDEIDE